MNIISSASRLVFLLFALVTCVGFIMNKVTNDQFIGLVSLIFAAYYRTNNTNSDGEGKNDTNTTTTTNTQTNTSSKPNAASTQTTTSTQKVK